MLEYVGVCRSTREYVGVRRSTREYVGVHGSKSGSTAEIADRDRTLTVVVVQASVTGDRSLACHLLFAV